MFFYLSQVDIGDGVKPVGYYVQRHSGLFPAPYPLNHVKLERICQLFHLLGIFLAKCLQDGRLVDIPLSKPFFKLMCTPPKLETIGDELHLEQSHEEGPTNEDDVKVDSNIDNQSHSNQELSDKEVAFQEMLLESSSDKIMSAAMAMDQDDVCASTAGDPEKGAAEMETCDPTNRDTKGYTSYELPWYAGILDSQDFETVYPHHAKLHHHLTQLVHEHKKIRENTSLTELEKLKAEKELHLHMEGTDTPVKLEDLG